MTPGESESRPPASEARVVAGPGFDHLADQGAQRVAGRTGGGEAAPVGHACEVKDKYRLDEVACFVGKCRKTVPAPTPARRATSWVDPSAPCSANT